MNQIIQSLFDRKSCRIFKDKQISQEERKLILEACMQAPSAGNQQMYTIIDVQDKKLQETLSKTCDNQSFINQAKMVLIFCADFQKWYDFETGQFKEGAPQELIEKVKAEDEERRLAYEQALRDGFIL